VDAEQMLQAANRTWAIFIGIGDYETNVLDIVGYKQDSAVVYTDVTMPSVTGQPYLESVCYVDKHPQVGSSRLLCCCRQWSCIPPSSYTTCLRASNLHCLP
jgi:hypothetical protein